MDQGLCGCKVAPYCFRKCLVVLLIYRNFSTSPESLQNSVLFCLIWEIRNSFLLELSVGLHRTAEESINWQGGNAFPEQSSFPGGKGKKLWDTGKSLLGG